MSHPFPPLTSRFRFIPRLVCVIGFTMVAILSAPLAQADPRNDIAKAKELADPMLAGANDWDCKPSAEHPKPVVLVHGLFLRAAINWSYVSPRLSSAGFCVFALNYGMSGGGLPGTSLMQVSAKELKTFVTGVKAATGAAKVDLLGHSQGGLMPRWYLRFEDGARDVDNFVALAAPNHGSSRNLFALLPPELGDVICRSCYQFSEGSEFLTELNHGREIESGVSYTTINTRWDQAVVPYTSGYLNGASTSITNVRLQDACPDNRSGHAGIGYDRVMFQWALDALARTGPANPGLEPRC
ncbi:esterase/lipase family protein [Streptomyces gobiensis]|uniref:esterase/lipase family protein n=1 Tax=Streptomyces gobiensis TaxID=2875706 RepID=UPI001E30EF22|nr:alpha/beta fold hydrolase [Streptomyces gobiensis]UGY94129.1 alpha/beta fold hydrolase [Streptomyces gobiensis]